MFDLLNGLHAFEHVAALAGISVGALAGLVALGWFVASARPFAIAAGVAIGMGVGGYLYGDRTRGREDAAQWAAAVARAADQAKARDAAAAAAIDAKYAPAIAARDKSIDDLKQQVDRYEKSILSAKSSAGAGQCRLGDAPLQLRARRN